jgi:predicted flap endonuclease-1-like 5' DNA nuclease
LEHKHSGRKKDIPHRSDDEAEVEKSILDRDIDLDLQDVEGIGPATSKKPKEAGIKSVMELAVTNIDQLVVDINSSCGTCKI